MSKSSPLLRPFALACAALATASLTHAATAPSGPLMYIQADTIASGTWLVDWQPAKRAHVVTPDGNADGSWTTRPDGERVITLDAPISSTYDTYDCNGEPFQQRTDLRKLGVRDTAGGTNRGTSGIVTVGTITDLGGCTPGLVTPFGSLADPGVTSSRLAMSLRAPMTDLVDGVAIAGFSEAPWSMTWPAQDVVSVIPGGLLFTTTGDKLATTMSPDGWLVFDAPDGARAYTRISVDAQTTGEVGSPGTELEFAL